MQVQATRAGFGFYALIIPMMLLMAGVGLDLGWYYLTVSRMQNAADAAVMAGAWEFLSDEGTLSDYSDAVLIDFVPSYILKDPETEKAVLSTRSSETDDDAAKAYVKKNLAPDGTWTDDTIPDSYDGENTLTFDSKLYGRGYDEDSYWTMWYQVILEENVKHFFLPGWFFPMNAKVQAVAKITHYAQGPDLFHQTETIADTQTYESWDHVRATKSSADADNRSVLSTGNKYKEGDKNRIEVLRLNGTGGINKDLSGGGGNKGNPYNSIGKVNQTGYDDLFIDWQTDMSKMTTDLDLGVNNAKSDAGKNWSHFLTDSGTINLTGDENLKRRIHGIINFEPQIDTNGNKVLKNGKEQFPYPVREGREPPDPLYARIESEPVHDGSGLTANGTRIEGSNASSVRQIIINMNVSNAEATFDSGEYKGEYSDRPVFFYYKGPEKIDKNSHVRDSLPVILNFNADFRGIFFFPNSPVVVNGNQKNFQGYVIAKEYVRLKKYKYDDYEPEAGNGDYLRFVAAEAANDIYYDRSLLITGGTKRVDQSSDFEKIVIDGETKYVLKSDLITDVSNLITIDGKTYRKDEAGSAETLAYVSGNGKINYYYTLRKKKNEGWTYAGTGWLDRKTAIAKGKLTTFQSGWSYNNDGNDDNDNGKATGQGVWRVKELLADAITEDSQWLDEKDEYKNKFLLKVAGDIATHPPEYLYSTADELLTALGGYTKIDDTNWKKDDAREYIQFTSGGQTYYIPSRVALFDGDTLVPDSITSNIIPVKYWEDGVEKTGCADISDDPEKFYLMYQDDY